MSISFIRSYLSKFSKEYPQINYELYEVTVLQQTEQMLSGQTEIGVAQCAPDPGRAFRRALYQAGAAGRRNAQGKSLAAYRR